MIVRELIDNSFNKKNSLSYDLSILIGVDRFSYLVVNQTNILVLHEYSLNATQEPFLKKIHTKFQTDTLLSCSFRSVKVAFEGRSFTLVPSRLYEEENKAVYLENSLRTNHRKEEIFADIPKSLSIAVVYTLDAELLKTIKNYLPNAVFLHAISAHLVTASQRLENEWGTKVFLNISSDNQFSCLIFEDNQVLFANEYNFKTATDLLFYLISNFDAFKPKLSPETTPVFLSGFIMPDSEIYRLLFRHIRHLHFLPRASFNPNVSTIQQPEGTEHLYLALFNVSEF